MQPASRPIQFWATAAFRGVLLFLVLNILFASGNPRGFGKFSAYNFIFPGRERLPFGEDSARSYNLSLYNLDAMFASHEVSASPRPPEELRVFLVGDSSVWGTLLSNEDTLSGRLNARALQVCGRKASFFNLGYPTISLAKDLLVINRAMAYQPDLIIWLTTLEAFPRDKQTSSPLVANNQEEMTSLLVGLGLPEYRMFPAKSSWWQKTMIGQRRSLADLLRLQMYGVMWAATGIDQDLDTQYEPAARDFAVDNAFHDFESEAEMDGKLAWDLLAGGKELAGNVPILFVNEPVLVSQGANSDLRYNLFYPRWAYDAYREDLLNFASSQGMNYLDAWNLVNPSDFTNSAIHLTPQGETDLADLLGDTLTSTCLLEQDGTGIIFSGNN